MPTQRSGVSLLLLSGTVFVIFAAFKCKNSAEQTNCKRSGLIPRTAASRSPQSNVAESFPQFKCTESTRLGTRLAESSYYISSDSKSRGLECFLKELVEFNAAVVVTLPGQHGFPNGLALRKSLTVPPYYCFTFHPTKDRFVSGAFFEKGIFDENVLRFVRDAVLHEKQRKPGHLCRVIDAGTNIGIVSLYAAALGCKVDSFEMQYRTRELFTRSVRLNGFDSQIKLHPGAIHYKNGMHVDISFESEYKDNIGGVTMMLSEPIPGPALDERSQADTTVIHDIVDVADDITVMKIDVEGAEELVLSSSANLWKAGRIRHLIMETRRTQFGLFEQLFEADFVCGFDDKLFENFASMLKGLTSRKMSDAEYVDAVCHLRGTEYVATK